MPIAWTMVGPGGRPQPGRPIHSGGINPNVVPQPTVSGPTTSAPARAPPVRTASQDQKTQLVKPSTPVNGVEDFQKWCRSQLKSLSGVNCINPSSPVLIL